MSAPHPFIKPYCRQMGSFGYYTAAEMDAAKRTQAPADAYASKDGPEKAKGPDDWHLVRNMDEHGRERLERAAGVTVASLLS